MNDLESRLLQAGRQPAPGAGPDLDAITRRGSARRRNKRVGAGAGMAAVIAVAAFGLAPTLNDGPTSVEAAESIDSEELTDEAATEESTSDDGEGSDGAGGQNDDAAEGGDDPDAAIEDTEPGDGDPGDDSGDGADDDATDTEPTVGSLLVDNTESGAICFSYDDPATGAGTLSLALDTNSGNIVVEERRNRGGQSDPGFVYSFSGTTPDGVSPIRASGPYISEGDVGETELERVVTVAPDLSQASTEGFEFTTVGCPDTEPEAGAGAGALDDGLGGTLLIEQGQLVHRRTADGDDVVIQLPIPDGVTGVQHWVTDVAPLDGVPYLFIDQFVNREPAAGQESNFEVAILAVNLATDEVIEVERRIITATNSPEWVYNGHITTDGTNILVMRELWQSHCLYAEGLTIEGAPVEIPQSVDYPKPLGLDELTAAQIDEIQGNFSEPGVSPCLTLDDVPDGGLAALGRQADFDRFAAFRDAFSAALGSVG